MRAVETSRARALAAALHADDREEDGTPLMRHIRRVARRTPAEAQALAWLHEALEATGVPEHELLAGGLTLDELRALRLLNRATDSRSGRAYMAHVELIARAEGESGRLARMVKVADLEDRRLHPHVRLDGWSPPYARALLLLQTADERPPAAVAGIG
jgi:hypothetical protein